MSKRFPADDEVSPRKRGRAMEDVRDKRQSRITFKRYIQELEENELKEQLDELDD